METKTLATFKTVDLPKRTLAYVRNVGPYQGDTKLFEKLFNEVSSWLMSKDLLIPHAECISIYHDDLETVPVEKQRISVGFTVPEGTIGEGNIKIMEIPAGKFFTGTFEIFPNEYGMAWEELMTELYKSNLKLGEFMYESYKNDPNEHPEGKHITDICVSVL